MNEVYVGAKFFLISFIVCYKFRLTGKPSLGISERFLPAVCISQRDDVD
jgi:hypothetical protein